MTTRVLIHVKIQSRHDADFAEPMSCYHALLLDRDLPPVVSLAVLGDDKPNERPDRFWYNFYGMETFVTSFEEMGRAKGLAESQLKGWRDLVLRQLIRKVGLLAVKIHGQITALNTEQLLRLSEALLDFTTWLEQQTTTTGNYSRSGVTQCCRHITSSDYVISSVGIPHPSTLA